jgi:hypothetical protein
MLSEADIRNLDLEYLVKRLVDRDQWTQNDAKEAVRRYKNFLILICKYPQAVVAPAPDIDEVWHTHILFTREYTRDCKAIFGNYLHHAPSQNSGPEETRRMEEAQSRAADLYHKEFNELYFLELDISSFW